MTFDISVTVVHFDSIYNKFEDKNWRSHDEKRFFFDY